MKRHMLGPRLFINDMSNSFADMDNRFQILFALCIMQQLQACNIFKFNHYEYFLHFLRSRINSKNQ